jgi:predicted RNase H-like HicB family nuclease
MSLYFHQLATPAEAVEIAKGLRPTLRAAEDADMRQYIALIHKEANSDYGVSFPDLPGVISAGETLDEARDMADEALALHLEGLATDGGATPEPSRLEDIMKGTQNRDGVAILVAAPATDVKSVRINVTMPADVLDQIDRYAEREGFTRSGFLAQAAKKVMAG